MANTHAKFENDFLQSNMVHSFRPPTYGEPEKRAMTAVTARRSRQCVACHMDPWMSSLRAVRAGPMMLSTNGDSYDQRDEASRRLILFRRPAALSQPVRTADDWRASEQRTGGGLERDQDLQPRMRALLRRRGNDAIPERAHHRRSARNDRGSRADERAGAADFRRRTARPPRHL